MAWRQLTKDSVYSYLTQPEIALFDQSIMETDQGQTDSLTQIVSDVAAMVRGRIAAYAENQSLLPSNPTSIPPELFLDAIAIARFQLLTRFPQGNAFLDDGRKQAYKDALAHLDDVAAGKLIVQADVGGINPSSPVLWGSECKVRF